MTEESYFLDSTCIIHYLTQQKSLIAPLLDNPKVTLSFSILSFYEVAKYLAHHNTEEEKIQAILKDLEIKMNYVPVDRTLLVTAAKQGTRYHLAAMDSIIYASALQENAVLLTYDKDFKGLKDRKSVV